jgi:hypothetical protein
LRHSRRDDKRFSQVYDKINLIIDSNFKDFENLMESLQKLASLQQESNRLTIDFKILSYLKFESIDLSGAVNQLKLKIRKVEICDNECH